MQDLTFLTYLEIKINKENKAERGGCPFLQYATEGEKQTNKKPLRPPQKNPPKTKTKHKPSI